MNDVGADADAAYVLDLAARHRLTVSDDGDGLQHRPRITRRLFLEQSRHPMRHAILDLKAVTAGQLL